MRICLLSRGVEFKRGGIGRISQELSDRLEQRGHEVVKVMGGGSSLYSYFGHTLLKVPLKLSSIKADVYHAITPMEGIWILKEKSIATFLDMFMVTDKDRLGAGLDKKWKSSIGSKYFEFASKVSSRCRFIACISEETKNDLLSIIDLPEERVQVIRLGIREDLEPLKKKDKTFRIGYLGQLDKRKRVDLLIHRFKESGIKGELVIAGDGLDKYNLWEQAKGDVRIKFLGSIPDTSLKDFYNSLDVFVFPTWVEGYGLPIVEAMACRKPVIVLDDAKIPWDVKSRCIITQSLRLVFGNSNYLNNLCKGVDYDGNYEFSKSHSWDKCVDSYIDLYQEIIGEGKK